MEKCIVKKTLAAAADSAVAALKKHRRRKEARPQEMTRAALELFVEKGYAATRLDDIATRAGVSKGTLYLYFESKDALFEAVIREGLVPTLDAGEALLVGHQGDAATLLRELLAGWWETVRQPEMAGVLKLMISEARNFPSVAQFYREEVIVRGHQLLGAALNYGMSRGEFRVVDVPATIDILVSPLLMAAIWSHSFAPCCPVEMHDPNTYLQTHLDLVLNGLLVGRPVLRIQA